MDIGTIIRNKYGNIDNMIRKTGTRLSRAYLYLMVNGSEVNMTVAVMEELQKLLDLPTLDAVKEVVDNAKKVQ